MKRVALYDPDGRIVSCSMCEEWAVERLALQAPAGGGAIEVALDVTPATHKVAGGAAVPYSADAVARLSAKLGIGFEWSAADENWIDVRSAISVRAALLAAAKRERDRRIEGGFVWDGSPFDSDAAVSQPRLLGLFVASGTPLYPADGQPWRLADNSWRVLTAANAQAVFAALQMHLSSHFGASAAIEAQILAADAATLATIDPTQGWPA